MLRTAMTPLMLGGALALSGCAHNYTGEGAAIGTIGGAVIGAAAGGNVVTGMVVGAAAGAAVGSLIHKNGHCYRMYRNGRQYRVRCR